MAQTNAQKASVARTVATARARNQANPGSGIGGGLAPSSVASNPLQTKQTNTPGTFPSESQNYTQANVNQSGQNKQTVATNPAQNTSNNAQNGLVSGENIAQGGAVGGQPSNVPVQPQIQANQQPQNNAVTTNPTIVQPDTKKVETKTPSDPRKIPGSPENILEFNKKLQGLNKNGAITTGGYDNYKNNIAYDSLHPEQQKVADTFFKGYNDNITSDNAVDAIMGGQNIDQNHPTMQYAQKRVQNLRNYSAMTPQQLSDSMKSGKLMGMSVLDLQKYYPQQYQQAMEVRRQDVKKDQSKHTNSVISTVLNARYNKNKRFVAPETKPVTEYSDSINTFMDDTINYSNDPQGTQKTVKDFFTKNPQVLQAYSELAMLESQITINNRQKEANAYQWVGKQNDLSGGQMSAIISNQSFGLDMDSFNKASQAIILQGQMSAYMKPLEMMLSAQKEDRSYGMDVRKQDFAEKANVRDYEYKAGQDVIDNNFKQQQLDSAEWDTQKLTNAYGDETIVRVNKRTGEIRGGGSGGGSNNTSGFTNPGDSTRSFVGRREGFRNQAYQDTGGVWTIGYGFTNINGKPVQPGQTISQEEADREFDKQLSQYQNWKNYVKVPLGPQQEAALTSFEYNLGKGIWDKNAMPIINAVNNGDFQKAGDIMKKYTRDKTGGVVKGLVNRRNSEAQMLMQTQQEPQNNAGISDYEGIIKTILGSGKFTKQQAGAIRKAISEGGDAVSVIKTNAKTLMQTDTAKKTENLETTQGKVSNLKNLLKQYYEKGGKTGLFDGKYEDTLNKLGRVDNKELVTIATEIKRTLQAYRNAVSGTAYSVQEGAEIASVFPGINKSQDLNDAIISGVIDDMQTEIDQNYRTILGAGYDKIKSGNNQQGGLNISQPTNNQGLGNVQQMKGFDDLRNSL